MVGVYQIRSKVKPDRIYIGSSINIGDRWSGHKRDLKRGTHGSRKLQRHCNKYGIDDLQFSLLLTCEKDNLLNVEQYFIDAYKPYFNCSPKAGSRLGIKASPETIEKLRISHKGKKNPHPGYPRTEETKKKIGAGSRGNKYALGYKHTDEAKKKISEASKGHVCPEDVKLRISKANTGKKRSEATRKLLSDLRKLQKGKKRGKYNMKKTA